MNKRTQAILDALDERYGIDVACHLHYKEPWQLLIATILKCTVYGCQSQYCDEGFICEISRY